MDSLQGLKVVTAKEMARIEALAIQDGCENEAFMNAAGEKVALAAIALIAKQKFPKKVTLLIGKGNKGGDAYVAGTLLLKKNYAVKAFHLYDFDDCSPLCRLQGERFLHEGGSIHFPENAADVIFEKNSLLIDGLFGTGFEGALEGLVLEVVQKANASSLPIIAIDIPSGVNGSKGDVLTSAIKATQTVYLGLPKLGFFIKNGYNHVGSLVYADFGLPEKYITEAKEAAYLVDESKLSKALPPVVRTRHKYQKGYVIGIAGSKGMGGAAKLSSMAALRGGAGIVRLFYSEEMEEEMNNAPLELIREKWTPQDLPKVLEAIQKAGAVFIGPGMGRSKETEKFFQALLMKIEKPVVLDADALFFLAQHVDVKLPKDTIITPHRGEMLRLLGEDKISEHEWQFLEKCQKFSEKHKVVLVLKGAPTFIFYPKEKPFIIPRGDPGMATAGTGDVLTGIIASFLAQGLSTYHAAILGVYLHALAGESAVSDKTSFSMIASDLIENLPKAFKKILHL